MFPERSSDIATQHRHVNQNEIRVTGLSRSGNHAMIHWIRAQAPGRVCFLNCAEGKTNPYASARPMHDGRPYRANFPGFDLENERRGRFAPKDYLIFNHEDSFLSHACSDHFEEHHDAYVGPSRRRLDVLILRDPFNLFASRLRNPDGLVPPHIAARIWKQHARQFTGRVRKLRHEPVLISYNRWFADREYRARLADRLGLHFTDAGRSAVAACNGGSSFDGLRYDGRADRMRVLERWKHYTDNRAFREVFDLKMIELSEEIFGVIPGTENLFAPLSRAG